MPKTATIPDTALAGAGTHQTIPLIEEGGHRRLLIICSGVVGHSSLGILKIELSVLSPSHFHIIKVGNGNQSRTTHSPGYNDFALHTYNIVDIQRCQSASLT